MNCEERVKKWSEMVEWREPGRSGEELVKTLEPGRSDPPSHTTEYFSSLAVNVVYA